MTLFCSAFVVTASHGNVIGSIDTEVFTKTPLFGTRSSSSSLDNIHRHHHHCNFGFHRHSRRRRRHRSECCQKCSDHDGNNHEPLLNPTVKIWDDVFSVDDCSILHDWASAHESERYRATSASLSDVFTFRRPNDDDDDDDDVDENGISLEKSSSRMTMTSMTPLEYALNSILAELGDVTDGTVVEYWTRQHYLDLEVHADIDEAQLDEDGTLRYPTFGHVLYLKKDFSAISKRQQKRVQQQQQHVVYQPKDTKRDDCVTVGPTCIFPQQLGGWNYNPQTSYTTNNEDSVTTTTKTQSSTPPTETTRTTTPIVVVPVVPGRLLRFEGNAMHAVPRPCTKWSMTKSEQRDLEWNEESDYGDDEDDVRSVILFNTWNDRGPRYTGPVRYEDDGTSDDNDIGISEVDTNLVVTDDTVDDYNNSDVRISISTDDDDDQMNDAGIGMDLDYENECNHDSRLPDAFYTKTFLEANSLRCSPRHKWTTVRLRQTEYTFEEDMENRNGTSNVSVNLNVALMGNSKRRKHTKKYVQLQAPISILGHLEDDSIPHVVNVDIL